MTPLRTPSFRFGLLAPAALALALAGCGAGSRAATKPGAAPPAPPEGMVYIPGGTFRMGDDDSPFPYEAPAHEVTVHPFFMDGREVTNRQFREFVQATGYKTVAEKWGWSGVFDPETGEWGRSDGADWQHPDGAGSGIDGKDDYPVVQVCWDDAQAYSKWAGKRLPTEAEWEFAARGGLAGKKYAWGDELDPDGKPIANYWQGPFPHEDRGEDGYKGLAPVGMFPPNGYGLYDMASNAWEWVEDRFSPDYYRMTPKTDPRGPSVGGERVIRGGSFLCAENFCTGYRVAARNKTTPDSGTNHMGFRCVKDLR